MVRYSWFIVVLLLVSCGRPLQGLPTPADMRPSPTTFATAASTRPLEPPTTASTLVTSTTAFSATLAPLATPLSTRAVSPTFSLTPVPTRAATSVPTPTLSSQTPIVIVPRTTTAQSNEQRWRAQQTDRQVLAPPRAYSATAPIDVFWFDPITGQTLTVGRVIGAFPVQATFRLLPTNARALEIPYRIGRDLGLTALSPALVERMRVAGYSDYAEVFVLETEVIQE